jgi:hypothetical protein
MSLHLRFLAAIDGLQSLDTPVLVTSLGRDWPEFLKRGWITDEGHLTHVMAPFLDSESEVEVEADPDADCYRYRSPQNNRLVVRPLSDIAVCVIQIEPWLADLATLIGIEDRRRPHRSCLTPNHLWHLGEHRIVGTHDFAPVFVGRAWTRAPTAETFAALADALWPRAGVVLQAQRSATTLPRDHVIRGLDEFVRATDGMESFDADAFDRVLRGYVTASDESEPEQFLQGTRVKLPHFAASRMVSETRAAILKVMWGIEGKTPPSMKWAEVRTVVPSAARSFDEAFGDKQMREEYLELVKSGGHYRVRRQ